MRVRQEIAALALLACATLAGCSRAPACTFQIPRQSPGFAFRGKVMSEADVPMLPYNPYWISTDPSLPIVGSPEDPCAGQPYHPGRLPP
jgi:hypothetical protein